MPSPWELGGLSTKELGKRVFTSLNDDDVTGRAAQLAYYFFLAVFPGLIFVTSLLGLMAGPGTQLRQSLFNYIATAMPPSAYQLMQKTLQETTQASGGLKLLIGAVLALWSASSGMSAVQDTLNAVYSVKEGRPFWKSRGTALWLTVACALLMLAAVGIVLGGNALANFVAAHIGLGPVVVWTWKIVQWPIALFFLSLTFALVYYAAPDVEQRNWQWLTPGAVLGMFLWLVASFALRVYLHFFNSYSATYGSLGAVIILMLWFYVTGAVILIGAEINAVIENAAAKRGEPSAKHKGDKLPQEESRSGAAQQARQAEPRPRVA